MNTTFAKKKFFMPQLLNCSLNLLVYRFLLFGNLISQPVGRFLSLNGHVDGCSGRRGEGGDAGQPQKW